MGATDVVGGVFAAKGLAEHLYGVANGDPLAVIGLRADAIGIGQLVSEQIHGAAAATPIINAGLLAINAIQAMCGVTLDGPDDGARFSAGAQAMDTIADTVDSAAPTVDWQGDGASAYGRQNSLQRLRATSIAEVDRRVQRIIADQAGQVDDTKKFLDTTATALTAAIPLVLATRLLPPPPLVGIPMAEALEIAAVAAALPPAGAVTRALASAAAQNAGQLEQEVAEYLRVATDATPSGSDDLATPPPGDEADEQPPETPADEPDTAATVTPASPAGPLASPPAGGASTGGAPARAPAPTGAAAPPPVSPPVASQPAGAGMPSGMGSATSAMGGLGSGLAALFGAVASLVGTAVQAGVPSGQAAGEPADEDREQDETDRERDDDEPSDDPRPELPVTGVDAGTGAGRAPAEPGAPTPPPPAAPPAAPRTVPMAHT